jgi:hypothetical protein
MSRPLHRPIMNVTREDLYVLASKIKSGPKSITGVWSSGNLESELLVQTETFFTLYGSELFGESWQNWSFQESWQILSDSSSRKSSCLDTRATFYCTWHAYLPHIVLTSYLPGLRRTHVDEQSSIHQHEVNRHKNTLASITYRPVPKAGSTWPVHSFT